MLRVLFSAMILLGALSMPAMSFVYYDNGQSYAVWEKHHGGALHVIGTYESRNGCARFVGQRRGPPNHDMDNEFAASGVVQVTFTIENSTEYCDGPATVQKRMATTGAVTDDVVEIFYVSTGGRLLKHERTSIRG